VPDSFILSMVVLGAATVIASQAVITGAYSLAPSNPAGINMRRRELAHDKAGVQFFDRPGRYC
jgi:K+ potassium transporter